MIKVLALKNIYEKRSFFEKFDPDKQTWVVSDLKSKLEMQNILLAHRPLLEENAILRASEMWKKWLTQLRPDFKMVSGDLLRSQLSESLKKEDFYWAQTPGAAKTLLGFIQQLIPLLSHPDGDRVLQDWFENHSSSLIRWGHWYQLAKKYWQNLNEEKIYAPQWAPVLLQQESLDNLRWDREIIFDLGCDLSPMEVDLIKALSKKVPVKVIMPQPDWAKNYDSLLWTYKLLAEESIDFEKLGHPTFDSHLLKPFENIEYKKFASAIAEVKDAVSQIRIWLEQGLKPENISVLAPDIEHYWPSLNAQLAIEGIPVNKNQLARLSSFPDISRWLSRLTLHMNKIKTACLEESLFEESQSPPLPYDTFRRLFRNIYDETDISRHSYVQKYLKGPISPDQLQTRDEFIFKACQFLDKNQETKNIEVLIQRFYQETYPQLRVSFQQWLAFLQGLAAKIEIKLKSAHPGGIHCENLSSGEWTPAKGLIFLGCTEDQYKSGRNSGLNPQEVLSINQQTGFALPLLEQSQPEFDTLWNLSGRPEKVRMSCSATDFSGQVESPCKLWLSGALGAGLDVESLSLMQPNRGDELQSYFLNQWEGSIANPDLDKFEIPDSLRVGLDRDTNTGEGPSVAIPEKLRLSVSQVEGYLSCPFVFAARKLFSLSDLPDLDLDIDHMTKGQLMHALFEHLSEEPIVFDRSEKDLGEILESIKKEDKLLLGDESIWPAVKKQHIALGLRFLNFEKEWRKAYPQTKTVGRETKISGFWDSEKKVLATEGDFAFLGFIDRIDQNEKGQYALIDYKSSAAQSRNWGSWLKNDVLQLSLYTDAVEKGLTDLPSGEVVSTNYYVARTMDRSKGFHLEGESASLVGVKNNRFVAIDSSKKKKLIDEALEMFAFTVEKIKRGEFPPQPKEVTTCGTCPWQKICRAKHLN